MQLKKNINFMQMLVLWNTYTKKIREVDFGFLRHLYFSLPKDFKIEDYDLFTKELVKKLNDFESKYSDTDYLDENDNRCDSRYAKVWDFSSLM